MEEESSVVTLEYDDLVSGKDLSKEIKKAYGSDGLGVLTIKGVPKFAELKKKILPLAHKLAHLPEESKKKLEHEESMYNAGWSHGKEKFGDEPDYAKGSFYANPLNDAAGTDEHREKYPFFYPKNIWPTEDLPELEGLFKELGTIMYECSALLSKHIDTLIKQNIPEYEEHLLHSALSTTQKAKGRLLYYYPTENTQSEDAWIGWHNDSGFLTVLAGEMFFNDDTGEIIDNPDPGKGGLWIVDRKSGSVHVSWDSDQIAVQCGECLQIISGGLLVATPHCVRASAAPEGMKVGRASFPVFVDTHTDFPLSTPKGVTRDQVFIKTAKSRVPPLEDRWLKDGTPFVNFLGDTFKSYYEWTISGKASST